MNLNGMFNFEFLYHNGELYFLEVNPRYSGNIFCRDKSGNHPFLEKVIVPYVANCGVEVEKQPALELDFFSDQKVLYDTTWMQKKNVEKAVKQQNMFALGVEASQATAL